MPALVLGPLLRHVTTSSVSVWVETDGHALVSVTLGGRSWSAPTFMVAGRHYALVVVEGLEPGAAYPYRVHLTAPGEPGGEQVWPAADSPYPPSRILTLDPTRGVRLGFGSCRTSVPHDEQHTRSHGVDALRATAVALAADPDSRDRPDLIAFLGDQIYADEPPEAMLDYIARRRGPDSDPVGELKDYDEYAHLYGIAWSDPANRWLLSTVPSVMIFDDHDVRDDWNTSQAWHDRMNTLPWWHGRLIGALSSYWVYQHLGNLSPQDLAADAVWSAVADDLATRVDAAEADRVTEAAEVDLTAPLRDLAEGIDRSPENYRFSFAVDLPDARLVMIDSRAARVLDPGRRTMLDETEVAWLEEHLRGDVDHLLLGTSLPFLLPPGIHDLEAWNEAMCSGAWGSRVARWGEKLRQAVDLEHWAAFGHGFDQVIEATMQVARGQRGRAPATVVFLSGDVHNSYVTRLDDEHDHGARSQIVQAVCSPIRNPLPRHVRVLQGGLARGLATPMRALVRWSRKVPEASYPWSITDGPWFDNNLALLRVHQERVELSWRHGVIDEDPWHPRLEEVAVVQIDGTAPAAGPDDRHDRGAPGLSRAEQP